MLLLAKLPTTRNMSDVALIAELLETMDNCIPEEKSAMPPAPVMVEPPVMLTDRSEIVEAPKTSAVLICEIVDDDSATDISDTDVVQSSKVVAVD